MKKSILLFLLFLNVMFTFSQEKAKVVKEEITVQKTQENTNIPLDSIKNLYGARYVDYKIINHVHDTIQLDTILHINKYYKHNYTEKDDFEWLEQANQGLSYNRLGYHFLTNDILPKFGATNKLFNYLTAEEVKHYHVPTPTTILYYRSGFDGQVLNSTFTTNFGKHQNFFIGYKGLRSIGEYQNARASHAQFRTGYSYYNPKKRYQFRTHIVSQKIDNQENGGLTENSITEFIEDNPDFSARGRIDVNLNNSESFFKATRYYFEHELRILNSKNPLKANITNLKLGHSILVENQTYKFESNDVTYFDENEIFGDRDTAATNDKTKFNTTQNKVYLKFKSPYILGDFKVYGALNNARHEYDSIKQTDNLLVAKSNRNNYSSFGAHWKGTYKGAFINGYGEQVFTGKNKANNLHANAGFTLKNNTLLKAGLQLKTTIPNANTTLYQSNFSNFNWNRSFKNQIYRIVYGNLKTKWLNADVYIHQIKNYIYFNQNSVASQFSGTINHLKVKLANEFKFGKFRLNNSILYQKVAQGNSVFRVPEFVTRNSFYYQSYFFKGNPLHAQIGINFKYFTKYFINEFNPVLNELYLQNKTQIGSFPTLDFFVNAEIRRTRIYFAVENFTSSFSKKNYFTSPTQPGSDLKIRVGLVWNFWN